MSRVKPKAFWEKHVGAFLESGKSQREYCRAHGLKHRSLQYHLRENRLAELKNSTNLMKASEWLPMTIVEEPGTKITGKIRIQISRVTIDADQGFDDIHLAHVLRAVGAAC